MYRLRSAGDEDRTFVVEMARLACALDDRPLPDGDAPVVIQCLPSSPSAAVVAVDHAGQPLGAAWWHLHQPSMLQMPDGSTIPELTMGVADGSRGQGVRAALIEALVTKAESQFAVLALNVHLRNSAARPVLHARGLSGRREGPRTVRHRDDPRPASVSRSLREPLPLQPTTPRALFAGCPLSVARARRLAVLLTRAFRATRSSGRLTASDRLPT